MYIMVGSIPTKIFASVTLTTKLYVIAACGSAGQAEGEWDGETQGARTVREGQGGLRQSR